MKGHLLFVTSSNLAVNPRCVKEIELALELGYKASVVKFNFSNWSGGLDKSIVASLAPVTFYAINAGKKPFLPWLMSFMLARMASAVSLLVPRNTFVNSYATDRRSWLITSCLKAIPAKPDLIIAHNPATFWPVASFAKRKLIPYATDVEDFHPGEYTNGGRYRQMLSIMKSTLLKACYVSFASPLISQRTVAEINHISRPVTVYNSFRSAEFIPPAPSMHSKLRLVWYSQHIDFGRGLEKILPPLANVASCIEVTLIGSVRKGFEEFLKGFPFVQIVPPLPQQELHALLAGFDAGLAVEEKAANLNRQLCLTNKLWSYFQAGLYIVATDTLAQEQFLSAHKNHGVTVSLDSHQNMQSAIEKLIAQKEDIRVKSVDRYNEAARYSWDIEKRKLQSAWMNALTDKTAG